LIGHRAGGRNALPKLWFARHSGEGFAADRGFGRDPAPSRLPDRNFRFTTFERVQLRELTVIKRNGRRVPFDRDKLLRSLSIALRKRPVDPDQLEELVSKIVRELESLGESEVSSEAVGETVMEHLRNVDDVAYVRFASVYRNFREPKDFENALAELSGDDDPKADAAARK
jgi:transcriptional repressor NrdR